LFQPVLYRKLRYVEVLGQTNFYTRGSEGIAYQAWKPGACGKVCDGPQFHWSPLILGTKFPPLELDAGGGRATYNGGRHPGKRRL